MDRRLAIWRTCVGVQFVLAAALAAPLVALISEPLVRPDPPLKIRAIERPPLGRLGAVLSGRVQDLGDNGVGLAEVTVRHHATGRLLSTRLQRASTFAFQGMAPGHWTLQVTADGYEPYRERLSIAARDSHRTFDVWLEPTLAVRVTMTTPDGVPLSDALRAARLPPRALPRVLVTDRRPPVTLPLARGGGLDPLPSLATWMPTPNGGGCRGGLALHRRPPLHVVLCVGARQVAWQRLEAGQRKLAFTLSTEAVRRALARLTLRIQTPEGAPLADAWVEVAGQQTRLQPDGTGRVELRDWPSGPHDVRITAAKREQFLTRVDLQPGTEHDLGAVQLGAERRGWRGTVRDARGRPAANAAIRAIPLDLPFRRGLEPAGIPQSADSEGAFELRGIGRRRYLVIAAIGQTAIAWQRIDTSQACKPLHLTLRPTAPVTLTSGALAPFEAAWVELHDGGGNPVWADLVRRDRTAALRLPPGRYRARILRGGREWRRPVPVSNTGGSVQLDWPDAGAGEERGGKGRGGKGR